MYDPLMVCGPALSGAMEPDGTSKLACPSEPTWAVPRVVPPSEKVTVPVGLATPVDPMTNIPSVTVAPYSGEFGEDAM